MTLIVRDAIHRDLEDLCRLRPSRATHEAMLRESASGTARFLVALESSGVVGFASLFLAQPTSGPPKEFLPRLSDCFVGVPHRAHGVGRALLAARERIAVESGFEKVYVGVDPEQQPWWQAFFIRRGYHAVQPRPYARLEPRHLDDGRMIRVASARLDLARVFSRQALET